MFDNGTGTTKPVPHFIVTVIVRRFEPLLLASHAELRK